MRWIYLGAVAWSLASLASASGKTLTVAADGTGDCATLQQAIAAAPEGSAERTIIRIAPGTYAGPFLIPKNKPGITLQGSDPHTTILTWDRNVRDPIPAGNDGFNPGLQVRADDFQAVNLTIQNTSGDHGQALAMRLDGDREILVNCHLTGWQDTLMINGGRDYFLNCTIAGRVDFIYGSATAWFEHCDIHSRNGGHITAASTPQNHAFGFVFDHCTLTGDNIAWDPATTDPTTTRKPKFTPGTDLGRPWRPYASVTYLHCEMGSHIKPQGWNNWGKTSNEKTARFAEYDSTGPGAAPDKRFAWAHQLTDEQARAITEQSVLDGFDHWDPHAIAAALLQSSTTQPASASNAAH